MAEAALPAEATSTEQADIYAKTLDCVHCGLCLPVCPTYRESGRETSSPRGRIYLMRGVAEGSIPLEGVMADEAFLCLGCRACETACPSGVGFGSLLAHVRADVEREGVRAGWGARIERLVVDSIIPHPRRLRLLIALLRGLQTTRLDRLGARLFRSSLGKLVDQAPPIPAARQRRRLPRTIPAEGEMRGRVGLLAGCIMPELFAATNAATARVLARNGFEVSVVPTQTCCGALQSHSGSAELARNLLHRNAVAFADAGLEALVVNSAGCGAFLREAEEWIGADGADLAAKVRDVSEFLDARGIRAPDRRLELRVCYDDPCHLIHGQGIGAAPRRLLAQIPGLALVAHEDPSACCGAAGIYNLTHPEMSQAILDRKLEALALADPDVIATGNPGCMMQLRRGVAAADLRARVVHPIDLLDEAYR